MHWFRIDNRLIHGQIIEAWLPYTGARTMFVVNDDLAADELQQQIISLAVPGRVAVQFLRLDQLAAACGTTGDNTTLILFANCSDARRALDLGVTIAALNVGNLHYAPGKRQLCAHVALSDEDESCLRYLMGHDVELDFRCVPNDPTQIKGWL